MNYDALQSLGIRCKNIKGEQKTICPKCSNERKHKSDPCLSVNIIEGIYNCHNCGWHGFIKKPSKEYKRPPMSELKILSPKLVNWFASRGIANQTLIRYKISESIEYMPQIQAESKCINFNYFYYGTLVNVKYRDGAKNFKLVSGAMLSLYGLDVAIDNSDSELVITEGEIDTLSFFEAGVKTAVSVPNGASKGNQKLEWLEDLYHVFEGRRVLLATDTDEAGLSLRNEIARRLGKQNCLIISFPDGCKDANEVLLKYGPEALADCYKNATPFPIEGIEDASNVDLMALYDQGVPEGVGIDYDMDDSFQWCTGQVTLITGVPGHGKSTWLKNVISRLARLHDWVSFIYSAEEASTEFALTDMITIDTGKSFFTSQYCKRITKEEVTEMMPFMSEHFKYLKLADNDLTAEGILKKGEEMVKRYGIRAFIIDNMSTIEKGIPAAGESRHNAIQSILKEFIKFARHYGVHVFLVAHPKKMSKVNGQYDVPTGYDVGDSSHYYNLPDNGLTVYRNMATGQTEIHRWKVRFKYTGQMGCDYFKFDMCNSRYSSSQKLNNGDDKTKFKGQPSDYNRFITAGTT
jgi:twinkle protein